VATGKPLAVVVGVRSFEQEDNNQQKEETQTHTRTQGENREGAIAMAVISTVCPPSLLSVQTLRSHRFQKNGATCSPRTTTFRVRAVKIPAGVSCMAAFFLTFSVLVLFS
jgi:hypothetical protein